MRRFVYVLTVLTLAVAGLSSTASAHAPYSPAPTVVNDVTSSVAGTAVNVSAGIQFGGQAPVVLGEDAPGDAPPHPELGKALGLELTKVQAYRTGPTAPVTLEWVTAGLDGTPPPEALRYYWTFLVDGVGYSAQAKMSDFVSAANLGDGQPATIVDNLSSYQSGTLPNFRLRGNCGTVVALNNCGHIAWVTGEFDAEYDIVRFQLPLGHAKAPALRPGALLEPDTNGAYAAMQAGADLAQTRDTVALSETYEVPDATATAALLDSTGAVVRSAALSAGQDGRWVGTVTAPAAGTYTLRVTGCFATNCASQVSTVVAG